MLDAYEPPAQVFLACNFQYVPVDLVEFLDIHEDVVGRDVMTFKCPVCKETHESLIFT